MGRVMWSLLKSRCACVALAVAAVLVVVCWAISYPLMVRAGLAASIGQDHYELCSYRGIACVTIIENVPSPEQRSLSVRRTESFIANHWDDLYWGDSYAGFWAEDGSVWLSGEHGQSVNVRCISFAVPYWMVTALLALVPASELTRAARRRWRSMHGRCTDCGYPWLPAAGGECPACAARAHLIAPTPRTRLVSPIA